jgi:glycosyltransferase involved in cell wall biosynthesis
VSQAKAHFLFVGDGHKMASVRAILGDHVRGGHVTFTGLVAQKEGPRYLASSDILVSPHVSNADGSRFFGSPTKLYEYMAMGKAILASDLDQIGDVLAGSPRVGAEPAVGPADGEGDLALLCEPGNVAQLAQGLKMLAASPSWRERLGANARRRALGRYTWGHHVRAILERAEALDLVSPPPR